MSQHKPMHVDEFLKHVAFLVAMLLLVFGLWPFDQQPGVNSEIVLTQLGSKL